MVHRPDRVGGCAHGIVRRHHRRRPERHQEGVGVLDGQPARLHVPGCRHRRLHRRHLPHDHPRLLQGAAVPRFGICHPRHASRPGHASLRRPAEADADHLGHLHRRLARNRRRAAVLGLLVERRNPGLRLRRQPGVVGHRSAHGVAHGVLHEPAGLHDLLRRVPLRRRPPRGDLRDLGQPCRHCGGCCGRGRRWHRRRRRGRREGPGEARQGRREARTARSRTGRGRRVRRQGCRQGHQEPREGQGRRRQGPGGRR